ncbi:MAG TPA: acyl carrier protein [bacterium]|nr:acyl carrier protein [bacterium]
MSEVATKVKEIIMEKLGTSEDKVTPEASFRNDLGADSLSTVELMMELEEAFGVEIEDEEAEKIQTVKDAVAYIEQKLAQKSK